jgi:flagellar hook-associated protein 2
MDVNSLVTALVSSKTAGQAATIAALQTQDNTQISAYGTLSAALSALQAAVAPLSDGTTLNAFSTTLSGSGITATAASGAVAGTYSLNVSQVATAQVLTSAAYGSTTSLVTSGTASLTLSLGSNQTTISIDSAHSTLADIASAINSASNNPGVTASVVTGTDGAHLVLHSTASGSANAISIGVTGASSSDSINQLAIQTTAGTSLSGVTSATAAQLSANQSQFTNTANWTQTTAAQDAYFTIDGTAVTSASNTVTSALAGVTLNLTAAALGSSTSSSSSSSSSSTQTQTLTISQDTSAQSSAINNFVTLYNTLVSTMGALTAFSSTATSQGVLLGDSTLNMIQNQLASIVAGGVGSGSSKTTLASIGVTLQADGTLSLDSTTLDNALQNNQSALASLFNSTNGIAEQLNTNITSYTSTTGIIQNRTDALNNDLTSLTNQQTVLTNWQTQLTSMYNAQFTALNTLMATMNNNTQYLTQLFGGTNSAGALATNKS